MQSVDEAANSEVRHDVALDPDYDSGGGSADDDGDDDDDEGEGAKADDGRTINVGVTQTLKRHVKSAPGRLPADASEEDTDGYETDLDVVVQSEDETPLAFDDEQVAKYKRSCDKNMVVPVEYYTRHMKETAFVCDHHGLGPDGAAALAVSLCENDSIQTLSLRGNNIGGAGTKAIAVMLEENPAIAVLDLAENGLRSSGIKAVSKLLEDRMSKLESLDMGSNNFLDMDSTALMIGLKSDSNLSRLVLHDNRFGDPSAVRIGDMLTCNKSLVHLDLSWNCIRRRGGCAIADSLTSNQTLEHLNLNNNGIGDEGAIAFATALQSNTTLKELLLGSNGIGDAGARALAAMIRSNPNLKFLDLSHNPMSADAMKEVLEAILENNSLMSFAMDGIELNDECMQILNKIRDARPTLTLMTSYKIGQMSTADLMAQAQAAQQRFARNAVRVGQIGRGGKRQGTGKRAAKKSGAEKGGEDFRQTGIMDMSILDEFDSDDEDISMMRDWLNRFPNLPDPMLELERYVDSNSLRLVDLFFSIDKDRSGGVTWEELRDAVDSFDGLVLNEDQQDELIMRLDADGDGEIQYIELCEGRRTLTEKLRRRDPRWTTYSSESESSEEEEEDDDDEDED